MGLKGLFVLAICAVQVTGLSVSGVRAVSARRRSMLLSAPGEEEVAPEEESGLETRLSTTARRAGALSGELSIVTFAT